MRIAACVTFLLVNIDVLRYGAFVSIPCKPCSCYRTGREVTADCSNRRLKHVPRTIPTSTTHLQMELNNLLHLPNQTFSSLTKLKILDLSHNNISVVDVDAFSRLRKLESLNLHGNTLILQDTTYPYGLFKDLGHLQTLDISKNDNSRKRNSSYPDKTLSQLFSLRDLSMDGLENASLGEEFSTLRHLTNLSLSGHRGYCSIYQLLNDSFIHVSSLMFLDISKCLIGDICRFAFDPLNSINTLDLSNNKHLGLDKFGRALYGLRNSRIRVLIANSVVPTFAIGIYINTTHICHLKSTGLRELHIDSNRIELIDPFFPTCLQQVEILSLRYNRITFGLYLFSLDPFLNLRSLDASSQYRSNKLPFNYQLKAICHLGKYHYSDTRNTVSQSNNLGYGYLTSSVRLKKHMLHNSFREPRDANPSTDELFLLKITIPIPPKVTFFNMSRSKMNYELDELHFGPNEVKVLDMSYNVFTKWLGPLYPLNNLEHLILNNNFCTKIGRFFLKHAPNLKILDISDNILSKSLWEDKKGEIFKSQSQLEHLYISRNLLNKLPRDIFKNLKNLILLDLSWNRMSSWIVKIQHLLNFRFLDLSHNQLEIVPEILREEIDIIMVTQNDTFHINISGNNFKCVCRTLNSLEWMLNSYLVIDDEHNSTCELGDGTSMTLDQKQTIVLDLRKKCKTSLPLIFGSLVGIMLFLVILVGGIVYRYRWKLRYIYYTTRRKYRGYQRLTEEDNFTYDAFVSYADDDRDFVVNKMRDKLEEKFGLKLCIHHRDFLVGEAITANIINAVQSSRKTVAILSPNFIKSSWCNYEVHMARLESIHTGRNVLCLVWYTDVARSRDIPDELLEEIATGTYIRFTDDVHGEELFWTSLRDAIQH